MFQTVVYLGFSRARGQSQFGPPHRARSWQLRCEGLGVNGRRQLTRAPRVVVSRLV